jgi:hypothetical protein
MAHRKDEEFLGAAEERKSEQHDVNIVDGENVEEDPHHHLHRGLKSRQITMIAIGGAIGTGLIIGTYVPSALWESRLLKEQTDAMQWLGPCDCRPSTFVYWLYHCGISLLLGYGCFGRGKSLHGYVKRCLSAFLSWRYRPASMFFCNPVQVLDHLRNSFLPQLSA